MKKVRIAIIRENKIPVDTRTPLNPEQCSNILNNYSDIELVVQSSPHRCYKDNEYVDVGIEVVEDVQDCDILFGVKEVPADLLIPNKTYFFFSHTIKKQPYNKKLLQTILERKIRLIDYECLTNNDGIRVIAFGRWAGIVGTYNAFWTYGKKTGKFDIKRAVDCHDLVDLKKEFRKIKPGPVKIIITGNGRVSKGGLEVLDGIGIRKVNPEDFISGNYSEAVYTQTDVDKYNKRTDGEPFEFSHFFKDPEAYYSVFKPFSLNADILIMASFWDPKAPILFNLPDISKPAFKIGVIADITCDINGAVPTTHRSTTIDNPVYDISRETLSEVAPFSSPENIAEMAIDNLPNELPRDASTSFGDQLIDEVLPDLLGTDQRKRIKNATIANNGSLTEKFNYLKDYVAG